MKVALDITKMHSLSQGRGIGIYAQNLYDSIKKYTNVDIKLCTEKYNPADFDLIHIPFFDFFRHSLSSKMLVPTIVTIPDLVPIQFADHYPPGIKGKLNWFLQKRAIKNVNSIITISETVKKDIERILKIPDSKISVTYLAPSEEYSKDLSKSDLEKIKAKYNLPAEYVLFVGNVNWNKNILNTAEAVTRANKNLVIIGKAFLDKANLNHPEKKSQKLFLKKYENNPLVKIIGFVEEKDLVGIMKLAGSLIFVSFYEGFGLPILEAQAAGLPVITSKVSATAEVAGKGAILVDPENVSEISSTIERVLNSEKLAKAMKALGKENLKRFSWKKTAIDTVQVYEKTLKAI